MPRNPHGLKLFKISLSICSPVCSPVLLGLPLEPDWYAVACNLIRNRPFSTKHQSQPSRIIQHVQHDKAAHTVGALFEDGKKVCPVHGLNYQRPSMASTRATATENALSRRATQSASLSMSRA